MYTEYVDGVYVGNKMYAYGWLSYEDKLESIFDVYDCDLMFLEDDKYKSNRPIEDDVRRLVDTLVEMNESERNVQGD
jgi:hypothetical protein